VGTVAAVLHRQNREPHLSGRVVCARERPEQAPDVD